MTGFGSTICFENYWSTLVVRSGAEATFGFGSWCVGCVRATSTGWCIWVTITWLHTWYSPATQCDLFKTLSGGSWSCNQLWTKRPALQHAYCRMRHVFVGLIGKWIALVSTLDGLAVMRANRCCQWRSWQRQWGAALIAVCQPLPCRRWSTAFNIHVEFMIFILRIFRPCAFLTWIQLKTHEDLVGS